MKILALDLGKRKTVTLSRVVETAQEASRTVDTTAEALGELFAKEKPDRILLEVGSHSGWVFDLASRHCNDVQVANTSADAWKWKNVRSKTDRRDCRKMMDLSLAGIFPRVTVLPPEAREWKRMVRYRIKLVRRQSAIKNNIRAIFDRQGLAGTLPAGRKAWTQIELDKVRALAKPLEQLAAGNYWQVELHSELKALEAVAEQVAAVQAPLDERIAGDKYGILLQGIPGVGPRTAEMLATTIGNPERFDTGRQVAAYFGFDPRKFQSGDTDRTGGISKQGDRTARATVLEAAWLALRYNPAVKEIFDRVSAGCKSRRKIAIVAAARHLVIWAWAMMRDAKAWDASRHPVTPDPTAPSVLIVATVPEAAPAAASVAATPAAATTTETATTKTPRTKAKSRTKAAEKTPKAKTERGNRRRVDKAAEPPTGGEAPGALPPDPRSLSQEAGPRRGGPAADEGVEKSGAGNPPRPRAAHPPAGRSSRTPAELHPPGGEGS